MLIGGMTIIGIAAATQLSYYYVMGELVPMKYRLAGNAVCYALLIPVRVIPLDKTPTRDILLITDS